MDVIRLCSLNDAGDEYLLVGAYVRAPDARQRASCSGSAVGVCRILQLGRQPIRIDLLTSITGVSWQKAWAGRMQGHCGSIAVHYLGRSELVENKSATGRLKDKSDVAAL